jgi:hypothetical protein
MGTGAVRVYGDMMQPEKAAYYQLQEGLALKDSHNAKFGSNIRKMRNGRLPGAMRLFKKTEAKGEEKKGTREELKYSLHPSGPCCHAVFKHSIRLRKTYTARPSRPLVLTEVSSGVINVSQVSR